jgi:Protein of unknown function (DUF3237)
MLLVANPRGDDMTLLGTDALPSLQTEHLCDFSVDFEPTQILTTPMGVRMMYVITRGTVDGPALRGRFIPGGGDWVIVGTDRVARLNVRATIRTHDGELVYVTVTGRAQLSDEAIDRLYAGELIRWDEMYARTAPLFETGAEPYMWLNATVAIGFNQFSLRHVDYRIYAVK